MVFHILQHFNIIFFKNKNLFLIQLFELHRVELKKIKTFPNFFSFYSITNSRILTKFFSFSAETFFKLLRQVQGIRILLIEKKYEKMIFDNPPQCTYEGREAATAASEDERQLSEARVRLYMLQQICNSGPTAGGLTRGTLGQVLQGTVEKNIRNGM